MYVTLIGLYEQAIMNIWKTNNAIIFVNDETRVEIGRDIFDSIEIDLHPLDNTIFITAHYRYTTSNETYLLSTENLKIGMM